MNDNELEDFYLNLAKEPITPPAKVQPTGLAKYSRLFAKGATLGLAGKDVESENLPQMVTEFAGSVLPIGLITGGVGAAAGATRAGAALARIAPTASRLATATASGAVYGGAKELASGESPSLSSVSKAAGEEAAWWLAGEGAFIGLGKAWAGRAATKAQAKAQSEAISQLKGGESLNLNEEALTRLGYSRTPRATETVEGQKGKASNLIRSMDAEENARINASIQATEASSLMERISPSAIPESESLKPPGPQVSEFGPNISRAEPEVGYFEGGHIGAIEKLPGFPEVEHYSTASPVYALVNKETPRAIPEHKPQLNDFILEPKPSEIEKTIRGGSDAASEKFYINRNEDGNVKLYGPFNSEAEAYQSNYFLKSVDERDQLGRKGQLDYYIKGGIYQYDQNELRALTTRPEETGYKSVSILPPDAIPEHSSWGTFDEAARRFVYESDTRQTGAYTPKLLVRSTDNATNLETLISIDPEIDDIIKLAAENPIQRETGLQFTPEQAKNLVSDPVVVAKLEEPVLARQESIIAKVGDLSEEEVANFMNTKVIEQGKLKVITPSVEDIKIRELARKFGMADDEISALSKEVDNHIKGINEELNRIGAKGLDPQAERQRRVDYLREVFKKKCL